jgi:ATP-dependent DNA helicase PIF1
MNEGQQQVLEKVKNGLNVCITGGAGTGKSYLIGEIFSTLHSTKHMAVTAMTGSAALLIRGTTLHRRLSLRLAKGTASEIASNISKYRKYTAYYDILELDLLIIDECSMLNDILFDKVSSVLQILRRNQRPFGGVQVVLVGDLYQLPPVEGRYCFQSATWPKCHFEICELTQNMRQKDDEPFMEMLKRLRLGRCSREDLAVLRSLKETQFTEGIEPTKLYCKNVDVDLINSEALQKIGGQLFTFPTRYTGSKEASAQYAKASNVPEQVTVSIGAQVMITYNYLPGAGLVNGTRGVVTALDQTTVTIRLLDGREETIPYVKIEQDDDPDVGLDFMPLKLAWAVTIHKSQGMTLDAIEIDIGSNIFTVGQAYTALSRARNLKSVRVVDVAARSFCTSKDVMDFFANSVKVTAPVKTN